ncbi:adenylate kinase [Spirochaetota bacterium]
MKLVFFGAPGAGKGTMAARASADFSIPHISTGDIFRNAMRAGTDLGKKVKSIIESGDLVSDELTISLVKDRLKNEDCQKGWILDGFPRTIPQAEALAVFCPPDLVIDLEVDDDTVLKRLSGRRMCKACGQIYHITNMPPKKEGLCDKCGSPLYIRDDDKKEAVLVRLENYRNQSLPLVEYYKNRKILFAVDSRGNADLVWDGLKKALSGMKGW